MSKPTTDYSNLAVELREIVGADGLIDKSEELLVYECDAYTLEKKQPHVVVLPRTTEQVVAIAKLCRNLCRASRSR